MKLKSWIGKLGTWFGLRATALECAQAIPILRGQLLEASGHAEAAIGNVCASFQSIADRSRETIDKAAGMLGSHAGEAASVDESVETSQATINGLLQRMEDAARISALAISRMQEVETSVAGMESLLREVDRIAFTSKLVALNAKIEAVHVGALGAGFEVVADEISRQSQRTNELTEGIAQRIEETRRCAQAAATHLRGSVEFENAQREHSRREAEAALRVLVSVHRRAHESLDLMSGEHSRLQEEISKAVVNLQFQDRFTQRVSHVVEVLERIETRLERRAQAESGKSLLEGLKDSYSMHEERQMQANVEGVAVEDSSPPGEVELF